MLGSALDIFRLRQYFDVLTYAREFVEGVQDDVGLLDDLRKVVVSLPMDEGASTLHPFPRASPFDAERIEGKRLALMATGGSGAMASIVGAFRALEEADRLPAVMSLCSGAAMFGFPLAAGLSADRVAEFTLSLRPSDYIDVDFRRLASTGAMGARGFAGIIDGERIEATYIGLLGEMTLGELRIPAYTPVWNVEHNRLDYLGPRTHPHLSVARAIRMAIAIPLLIEPVEMEGEWWCDGGIVDIFPVKPVLDIEGACDAALVVNGFYPPGFEGENATGWRERRASIMHLAGQVRTCQQVELARANLARVEKSLDVTMIDPVPYRTVRGSGFYRQFVNSRDWPEFMRAGRLHTRRALMHRR